MNDDTTMVDQIIDNIEVLYNERVRLINRVTWWDDDDDTWNDIGQAAVKLNEFVTDAIRANPSVAEQFDADVHLRAVDWEELVCGELEQCNRDAGRSAGAGLD